MYAMVNLIAGRRIVVELIQDDCTPEAVTSEAVRILTDQPYRDEMIARSTTCGRSSAGQARAIAPRRRFLNVVHSSDAP
jgi:lipid A disaccharide synthetase